MPNIKSAEKRVQLSRVQNLRNRAARSTLRTTLKKFDAAVVAGDKVAAAEAYTVAVKTVDRAATKGLLHKNNAAHKKSALTLKLVGMGK